MAHAARGPRLVWLSAACFAGLYPNKLHALRYGADLGTVAQSLLNFGNHDTTSDWPEGRFRTWKEDVVTIDRITRRPYRVGHSSLLDIGRLDNRGAKGQLVQRMSSQANVGLRSF
jgi:hypothetical protein